MTDLSWSTNTDWTAAQSTTNIDINSGAFGLADAIPDSGVARWTFDNAETSGGEAVDVWGGNNLTLNGPTTGLAGIAGYDSGEAYDFNGLDDEGYYDYSRSAISQFTATFWIRSRTDNGNKFFADDDNGNANAIGTIEAEHKNGVIRVYTGSWTRFGSLSTGTDAFVAVAVDNTMPETTVDINGSRQTNPIGNDLFTHNRLVIGRGQSGYEVYFDGLIDDPRLYGKRLSDTELDNLRTTGSIDG